MKPTFQLLWKHYPRVSEVSRKQLFTEIGWDSLADDPTYANTCAIRMSCALQKSGVSIKSSAGMKGLKGAMKNKDIEVRQDKLSEQLKRLWGKPVVLPESDVENAMGEKDGVISFFRIPGYLVGGRLGCHIDIVDGKGYAEVPFLLFWKRTIDVPSECGSSCQWNAGEAWFWELR